VTFHDELSPTDMAFHLNPGPVALADAIEKKVKEGARTRPEGHLG
jgi:hypothetical protein